MKHPIKKRIVCILTALALLIALACGFAAYGLMADTRDAEAQIHKELKSISSSLTHVFQANEVINDNYEKMLLKKARLGALPLRELVREGGDEEIRAYENGCVLRVTREAIATPEDMPFPAPEVQNFMDEAGALLSTGRFDLISKDSEDTEYLCAFQRITGDYYYLDYTAAEVRDNYMQACLDINSVCRNLEQAFGGYILVYAYVGENHVLFNAPRDFEGYWSIEDLGIDPGIAPQEIAETHLDGVKYFYTLSEPVVNIDTAQGYTIQVAFLMPYDGVPMRQLSRLLMALGIAAPFFIAAITWVLAVGDMVRRSVMTDAQRLRYSVERVRKIAAAIGMTGVLAVMLSTVLIDALLMLYNATQNNQALLKTMNAVVSQAEENEVKIKAQVEDSYVRYARRVADLLAANPRLCNRDTLQEICDIIDVDYLMLYDDRGREGLSNTAYVNLVFSSDETDPSYDFRRLLMGVPSIVHEAGADETTGLERQLIGVRMDDGDNSDGYGALILARIPKEDDRVLTLDQLIQAMTPENSLCLILNPDDGTIVHASDPACIDENALTLGMADFALQDNFMDYFRFKNARWYSCSDVFDQELYHCATRDGAIYSGIMFNALAFGAMFLAAYALLALVLLHDYTDKAIEEFGSVALDGEVAPLKKEGAAWDNDYDRLSMAIKEMRLIHKYRQPEKRAWFAFRLSFGCVLISVLTFITVWMNNHTGMYGTSILAYVMGDGWKRGVNLFAFTRIMLMAAGFAALITIMDLIRDLLCHMLEKRGETICHLVNSIIKYGCALAMLFSSFDLLGFDTKALLASVGVLSLAITLGAKDLVADVLSGISITFYDEYQIGDFVEIDRFRGWVMEIGVRLTTLVNSDGNIKNMSNRDVKNVLNLSRRNCRYTIDITIAYTQSLQEVEEILGRELPKIGESVKEIVSGPSYQGVTGIGNGGMTLTIVAECKEHNYGRVRAKLNREIRLMLENNNIAIK